MVVPRHDEVNEPGMGIGGWLALLCLLLLVWRPLNLAVATAGSLGSLTFRGLPMAVVVVAQLLVTGVGVAAGLALMNRRRGAATFAMWSLILSACMDVFVYSTSFLPNRRMPGTTPAFIAASLIYHGVWIAYLSRSKRVRNTFPAT
ncbi:MAG TPA: DUF2569 family protein [Vicinamibacterales bacterium]|nr:DUF2569 family protein [Vicinamibacterales bacterium]